MLTPMWCARVKIASQITSHSFSDSEDVVIAKTSNDDEVTQLQYAVQNVQSRVEKLKSAFVAKWPAVQESLGDFAEGTRDRAIALAKHLLVALNSTFCDPATKDAFRQKLAVMRSNLGQFATFIASVVAENWPGAKEALTSFGMVTAIKLRSLTKMIRKVADDSGLIDEVNSRFEALRNSAQQKIESREALMQVKAAISDFSGKVIALSERIAVTVHDVYKSEQMQAMLATIQSRTGQLISYLADRWPEIKAFVVEFAESARNKIVPVMEQIGHELNMCLPEKRQQAMEVIHAIQSRIGQVYSAMAHGVSLVRGQAIEKWPVVQEKLSDFTASLSFNVDAIRSSAESVLGPQGKKLQDALNAIQSEVEALRSGVGQSTTSSVLAGMAEHIKAHMANVFQYFPAIGSRAYANDVDADDGMELD